MTVKDLILKLKDMPLQANVVIERYTGCLEEMLPCEDVKLLSKDDKDKKDWPDGLPKRNIYEDDYVELI